MCRELGSRSCRQLQGHERSQRRHRECRETYFRAANESWMNECAIRIALVRRRRELSGGPPVFFWRSAPAASRAAPQGRGPLAARRTGVCEKNNPPEKKDCRRTTVQSTKISGWRAVSAAGLHGKGSCKRNVFFHRHR